MLKEKRLQTIHTTDKALELLEILAKGHQHLTLNDLAQRLKINKEEVLLLLVTIENRGLVTWDSQKKVYGPGGATLEMVKYLQQYFGYAHKPIATEVVS